MSQRKQDGDLPSDELVKRLRLSSQDLVADLYSIARDQLAAEDRRESNLNTKAVALLAAAGLSITVCSTFGSVLLEQLGSLAWAWLRYVAVGLYAVTLGCGLAAALFAVKSLLVRKSHRGIDEQEVFNEAVLADADNAGNPEQVGDSPSVNDPKPGSASAIYRRFMIAHLWQIYRNTFWLHEERARAVWMGQVLYCCFLGLVMPLGIVVAVSALPRSDDPNLASGERLVHWIADQGHQPAPGGIPPCFHPLLQDTPTEPMSASPICDHRIEIANEEQPY